MINDIKNDLNLKIEKVLSKLKAELLNIRTGIFTPSILDVVKVEAYGSVMPISQLANIMIPEPRVMEIKPWDTSILSNIEKAILKSPLGLTPNNDGKIIRLILPIMTEETRKELSKFASKLEEQFKIEIRNLRRDINEDLKKLEKEKQMTEDELFSAEKEVQNIIDACNKKITEIVDLKKKEIMTV